MLEPNEQVFLNLMEFLFVLKGRSLLDQAKETYSKCKRPFKSLISKNIKIVSNELI